MLEPQESQELGGAGGQLALAVLGTTVGQQAADHGLAGMAITAGHEVLPDGHRREDAGRLEGAAESRPGDGVRRLANQLDAREAYAAAVGARDARYQVEEGRFAGAVGTDEAGHAPANDVEGHAVDRPQAPEST